MLERGTSANRKIYAEAYAPPLAGLPWATSYIPRTLDCVKSPRLNLLGGFCRYLSASEGWKICLRKS